MVKYKEIIEVDTSSEDKGKRIDIFLSEFFGNVTRNYIQKLIDEEHVSINGKTKFKNGTKIKGSEHIVIRIPEDEILSILPENIPIDIVYEDEDIVVINKDAGIVVHPAQGFTNGTLVNAVMYHIKDLSTINGVIRPGIVHRLDKDTSGLIIIAKNDIVHNKLVEMFKEKTIEKKYICICKGNFKQTAGRIETLIGRDPKDRKKMAVLEKNGKIAISNYKVLDSTTNFSLVEVKIETGRTHQIRVHMKSLNHPIVGDSVYGNSSDIANRQMLHSFYLKFIHPINGKEIIIFGNLKEDFLEVAKNLKLDVSKISKLNK